MNRRHALKVGEFLSVQFSGVNKVYSAYHLLLGSWSPQIERIRNGFHRHRSGDLIIEVLPGWTVMQENSNDNRVVRAAAIPAPLILLGKGIKPEIIRMPVAVDRVAPTLSSAMRIRSQCLSHPTQLLIKAGTKELQSLYFRKLLILRNNP